MRFQSRGQIGILIQRNGLFDLGQISGKGPIVVAAHQLQADHTYRLVPFAFRSLFAVSF
jgi:hypothetical protein